MSLTSGSKLGPYEILEPIGEGGMGTVYRARDPRMGREVAIKVSAEEFSDRFSREVHAVAALSHPNVCTLHDVGPDYLVMELVEGRTLAERIKEGPIPLEEALPIARQIANALEAAHEKNIVHRDLKPANIKLKPDGTVKVLDFGLAMVELPPSASTEHSPTFATYQTQAGMILGTAAYMAPEQARGKAVDKRADIWSFGVVLVEMVSGKAPFQGEDVTEMLASVVKSDPDVTAVPHPLRHLIRKCLEKDPKKRLRDIGDVWELMREEPAVEAKSAATSLLPWAIAGILLLTAGALAFIHFREPAPDVQTVEFQIEAPAERQFANFYAGYSPSPDGRHVVFAVQESGGSSELWLRDLDSSTTRQLPGAGDAANTPFWSPDSKTIAFAANGKLKRLEIGGGAPINLINAQQDPVTAVGTWNTKGDILFGSSEGLKRLSATPGSDAKLITTVNRESKETGHGFPQFLPDGNRFLFFVASTDPNIQGVYASSLDHPDQRELVLHTSAKAVYAPPRSGFPGYLLWMQESTLFAQKFDANSLQSEGDAVAIADDIGVNPSIPIRASFWVSDGGVLTYFGRPERQKRPVVWIDRNGKVTEAAPAEIVFDIALSPDGKRLAFARENDVNGPANRDIWVRDLVSGVVTRLTTHSGYDALAVWSPDGKWIAYSAERDDGLRQIFRKDATGAGQEEMLTTGPAQKNVLDWSEDGKYILYREQNPDTGRDLMALEVNGDRKPIPVVQQPFAQNNGEISPDGRWVAYLSNDSARNEIYVQAFPGVKDAPSGRWQISSGGAQEIKWRQDGKEIYYESLDGKVMAVTLETSPQGVRGDTPRALFAADFPTGTTHTFDATKDGQRFLIIQNTKSAVENSNRLTVITNWQGMVGRKARP